MIACHTWSFARFSLEDVLPRLAALGFDAVELNAEAVPDGAPHVGPGMSRSDRRNLSLLLDQTGLKVSSISAHRSLIERKQAEREAALAFTRGCIDLAEELGTDIVHAFSGDLPEDVDAGTAWGWLQDGVQIAAAYAAERRIRFAVEAAIGRLVSTTVDLHRLVSAVSAPVYINFDPSHLHLLGEDIGASIRCLGSLIVHVHVKDARGVPGAFSFPPLGEGGVDFREFFAGLRGIAYRGYYSLEDEAREFGYPGDPFERARAGLAFVRRGLDASPT